MDSPKVGGPKVDGSKVDGQKWTVQVLQTLESKVDGPVLTKELDCPVYVQKTVQIVIFGQFVFDQKTYREQLHH